jgi:hypothetical protein
MTETRSMIIRLPEPLPCGITDGLTICARPATVAAVDPDPARPGRWTLTPICKVCAAGLAALYSEDAPEGQETHQERPGRA